MNKYTHPVPPKKRSYDDMAMSEIRSGIEEANRDIGRSTWDNMDANERTMMRAQYSALVNEHKALVHGAHIFLDKVASSAMQMNRIRKMYPGVAENHTLP